jgi:nucleoid-associated protein YgaU
LPVALRACFSVVANSQTKKNPKSIWILNIAHGMVAAHHPGRSRDPMTTPDKKPDFSNVQSSVTSTEQERPDFSNVQSKVTSTEEMRGGEGGGGGAGEQTYTIEKGDTLSAISKRFYGKAKFWSKIFEANRDTIENADKILPGQVIKLPQIDVDGDGEPDDPNVG